MTAYDACRDGDCNPYTSDAQHTDALARAMGGTVREDSQVRLPSLAERARRILDSTDPEVHAALLDALTRHGVLTEDTQHAVVDSGFVTRRCLRTPWRDLTSDEAIAFLRERLAGDQP